MHVLGGSFRPLPVPALWPNLKALKTSTSEAIKEQVSGILRAESYSSEAQGNAKIEKMLIWDAAILGWSDSY